MAFHRYLSGEELHYARVRVGSGNPNGSVEASIAGEIYIDTDTDTAYYSTAAGNSNWKQFGGSGGGGEVTQVKAEHKFVFDLSQCYNMGTGYYLKTKTPMLTDSNFFTIVDTATATELTYGTDWDFSTTPGAKLGRVPDLTDTIWVSNAYSGPIEVTYVEYVVPIFPVFYLARGDSNPVNNVMWYDYIVGPTTGENGYRTSVSYNTSDWSVTSNGPSLSRTYYYATRLYPAIGNYFSSNNWRIELYVLGRFTRGSGMGATNGLGTQGTGPRKKGISSLNPVFVNTATNGYFDLTQLYAGLFDSAKNIGYVHNEFLLRLRDTSNNKITLFSPQRLYVKKVSISDRSGGVRFNIPRVYLKV